MKLPAFLYGNNAKVKKACRKKALALGQGVPVDELPEDWVDTSSTPGALVLEGPTRLPGDHFQCYGLFGAATDLIVHNQLSSDVWERLHEAGMSRPWMFLGLLGQENALFLNKNPEWWKPFLKAAVDHWPVLDAEGARYTVGSTTLKPLWSMNTKIKNILALLGTPVETLKSPLPAGGLAELVANVLGEPS